MIDFAAIEQAPLARFIAVTAGVYPLVSALHIMGVALLFGPIALADLRLMGALGTKLDAALPTLRRAAVLGFVVAATTGLALASVQLATRYAGNPAFLLKLGLIVAAGLNLLVMEARRGAGAWAHAALSLSLWTSVILAGRWIAFLD